MSDKQERFMDLLRPVHDDVVRYIRAMTRDDAEARDVFGEVLLAAYEGFETLRDDTAFRFFLITIARRSFSRRLRRGRLFTRLDAHALESFWDPAPLPDRDADASLLHAMLHRLPARQHEAIVLFALQGYSLEEIRALQGGSLSGVKSRIARARQALETMLRDTPGAAAAASVPSPQMSAAASKVEEA